MFRSLTCAVVLMASAVPVVATAADLKEIPAHFAPTQADYDASVVLSDLEIPNWDFGEYWVRGEGDYLEVFRCYYDYNAAQNDWLILPQLKTQAGGKFSISYKACTTANVSYSLVWGTEPTEAAMTNVISKTDDYNSNATTEELSGEFEVPAGQNVYVGFHVYTPLGGGYFDIWDINVSQESTALPAAPELTIAMDGTSGVAQLTLPAFTIGGEAITADEVKATLVIDGRDDLTFNFSGEPGEEVGADFTVALGAHTAVATASYTDADGNELKSQPATKSFVASLPSDFALDLPLEFTPNADNLAMITILDMNQDGTTWEMLDTYPDQLRLAYNGKLAADDWAILPAVNVERPGKYKLTMGAAAHSAFCPESVELCLGTAADPANMTMTAIRLENLTEGRNGDDTLPVYEGEVEIKSPGKYFIGIHGFSKPDQLYVYVSTVTMSKIESADDYEFIDPAVYETLPADMFDIDILSATADGLHFTVNPKDMAMIYTNIMIDETYLTEDHLGDLDFADQIVKVSNQMLELMGSFDAAMSAEFFYLGNVDATSFGGTMPGTRAFLAVMGLSYDEATNTVSAATKVSRTDVFEFTDEYLPQEEPWAEISNPQYVDKGGKNVVRVDITPNDAAGDYVYAKAFAADYRKNHTDLEIIQYLTSTSNMMETWVFGSTFDAEVQPGERALIAVATLYKSSGKLGEKLNWVIVEAPEQVGGEVKVIATATDQSGISSIEADSSNSPVEFYTLDGRRVAADELVPGIYIRRQGGKAEKIVVR